MEKISEIKEFVFLFGTFIIISLFIQDVFVWKFLFHFSFNSFVDNIVYSFNEQFLFGFIAIYLMLVLFVFIFLMFFVLMKIFNRKIKFYIYKKLNKKYLFIILFLISILSFALVLFIFYRIYLNKINNLYFIIVLFLSIYISILIWEFKKINDFFRYYNLIILGLLGLLFIVSIIKNQRNLILFTYIYLIIYIIFITTYIFLISITFDSLKRKTDKKINLLRFSLLFFVFLNGFFMYGNYFNYNVGKNNLTYNLLLNGLFMNTTLIPNAIVLPSYWQGYNGCDIQYIDSSNLFIPLPGNKRIYFVKSNKNPNKYYLILLKIEEPDVIVNLKNNINMYVSNDTKVYTVLDIGYMVLKH